MFKTSRAKYNLIHLIRSITLPVLDILMPNKKNVAIWAAIIGGGIAFFFLYGYLADLMR